MTLLAILVVMVTHICSIGYAYESILVHSDDSKEIITNKIIAQESKDNDLSIFLSKNNIHTVEDYAHWLEKNMRYEKNIGKEEWESWQTTLNRRYGDCKNLSVLNAKVLELLGYQPVLIGYQKDLGGHLFTAFKKDGAYNIFDNTAYHVTKLRDVIEIGIFLYHKYNIETAFEVSLNSKTTKTLFTRSMLAQIR